MYRRRIALPFVAPSRRGRFRPAQGQAARLVVSAARKHGIQPGHEEWSKTFYKRAASCEFAQPPTRSPSDARRAPSFASKSGLRRWRPKTVRIIAESPGLSGPMARFTCIHGIGKVSAFSLACEVHDFERFRNGASFASYLGLVPSENSSGGKVSHGAGQAGQPPPEAHPRRGRFVLFEAVRGGEKRGCGDSRGRPREGR